MMETTLWQRYRNGRHYQAAMGFNTIFPQCIEFKEGRQWPAPTKATRNLPRPVFNLCERCVRTKRANVLNQSIKMVFSPAEGVTGEANTAHEEIGAKAFGDFANSLWKELHQDELNEDFIDDAATIGTGIFHYYWDSDVTGGTRFPWRGALRGETIDPSCIFFGNPQDTDVQAQPYIIIASRATVESVRELARTEGMHEDEVRLIVPDGESPEEYEASRREIEDERKCTLLTMYYRHGGSVYFDRGTQTADIIKGRSLTPGMPDLRKSVSYDEEVPEPDNLENEIVRTAVITRYPIAVMSWQKRKRSIYGIGEVEGMIPSQKAVNWLMGMNILSAQDTAWPKMIARPGALRQEVTNTPGEIIEDFSPAGDGIRYLAPPPVSSSTTVLVDKITDLLQYSTGVSEVVSGEPFTSTMAASAIIALQNQAKQPIESIQRRFYRVVEEVGRIWEEFFKTYYSMPRTVAARTLKGEKSSIVFVGTDFSDVDFSLEIDVGAGSEYSESLAQASLEKLFDMGQIDVDTYIELCPKNILPFKEQLKRMIAEKRQRDGKEG
ncbi:MAG: hypothetical protein IKL92_01055 [Oscillospiraceae bacterium]|nr:hypothetical protein [Oscillospiraceae bacterium]